METNRAAQLFDTLGHPGRLAVFRLLMRRAPQGVRPGEIGEALDIKPSTLSVYLSALEAAGLVAGRREGRAIFYAIDIPATRALASYFLDDCCRGRPDICLPASSPPSAGTATMTRVFNVLFVCSGNSARSIFAEALLADEGKGRFRAYSAGTRPFSELNPFALEVLQRNGHDTSGLRAKNIAEFQGEDAPKMDFVFTVCDQAASEECPPWPGQPITAHWGVADPVKQEGNAGEKGLAFARTYAELRRRITAFVALPIAELEKVALQQHLDDIGLDKE